MSEITLMGNPFTIKSTGHDTAGRCSLIEYTILPGTPDPPAHIHDKFDEGFYVMAGELTFNVSGRPMYATVGDFVFVPRGVAHTYTSPGLAPVRLLILVLPGGFEGYFEELARVFPRVEPPPNIATVQEILDRYGVRLADMPLR